MKERKIGGTGILGQWKYSIEHQNDRYISLHICPNVEYTILRVTCHKLWTLDDNDVSKHIHQC